MGKARDLSYSCHDIKRRGVSTLCFNATSGITRQWLKMRMYFSDTTWFRYFPEILVDTVKAFLKSMKVTTRGVRNSKLSSMMY